MKEKDLLKDLGFTEGEIRVYYSLFELGSATVGPISQKSKITHAKVYPILTKLIDKGLAGFSIKNGRKYFSATDPSNLLEFIDNKVRMLEDEKSRVKQIMPSLVARQKDKEEIQYSVVFEGFGGIKAAFNLIINTLKRGDEYYVFTVDEEVFAPELRTFFLNYHPKRIESGIKVKLLSKLKYKALINKKYPQYKLSERKFIDRAFPTGVFIFKDYVMNFIYEPKPTLFIVKSRQNYESYRKFFLELWEESVK